MGQGKSKFKYFSQLPPEIQREILNDPEILSKSQYLNKDISELMSLDYLEQICNRPISGQELLRQHEKWTTLGYMSARQPYPINQLYVHIDLPVPKGSQPFYRGFYKDIYLDKYTVIDPVSEYDILSNRRSCMKIDTDYARNRVLAKIDDMSERDVIQRYLYAIMSALVLGLIGIAELDDAVGSINSTDISRFMLLYSLRRSRLLDEMEKRSADLYPWIRKRFLDLH